MPPRHRHRLHRKEDEPPKTTPGCPTPQKRRFATDNTAEWKNSFRITIRGQNIEPYLCPCGFYHMRSVDKQKAWRPPKRRRKRS